MAIQRRLEDYEKMALPVLAFLAVNGPAAKQVIARGLKLKEAAVLECCMRLKDAGAIEKRFDGKWMMIYEVRLVPPGAPSVLLASPHTPEPVLQDPSRGVQAPVSATQQVVQVPKLTQRPPSLSNGALDVGRRFSVPPHLPGKGEARFEPPVKRCGVCTKPTPLKYGGQPVCPLCARKA